MKNTIHLKVSLVPLYDFFITAWSGSFALKIVHDIFHRVGIDYEKKEKKPFLVEPLMFETNQYILTGFYNRYWKNGQIIDKPHSKWNYAKIRSGTELILSIYFLKEDIVRKFIEALTENPVVKEPATELVSMGIEVTQLPPFTLEMKKQARFDSPKKVFIEVEFKSPTSFMFFGEDVLYPSPIRLLFNIAKAFSEVTGIDLRDRVVDWLKIIELKNFKINTYWVDIGEGRKVPCFIGKATYVVCGKRDTLMILQLFKFAEILGVGISRALGFGRIKVNFSGI